MNGIWSAVLTPVDDDLSPDTSRAIPYYRELLQRGCDGINVLGTTGEAMSFNVDRRTRFIELLASSGLPMDRVMAGTGAASLADAVALTRCAFECGLAAALVMPPFFFRDATDDGIAAFFDKLLSRAHTVSGRVVLYNFPRMSGITFNPALVERLVEEFPEAIAGLKDSSNDIALQAEVHARRPELAIFPGSERDLIAVKARGAAGCISGSVALWPELAQAVLRNGDQRQGDELSRRRGLLESLPLIPAVRYLTATSRGDPGWERVMPPQVALTPEQRRAVDVALAAVTANAG
jgi:4-hydroxy-tetrahydrodipicolinate synthase